MTKRQLVKWLEDKRYEAITTAEKKFSKMTGDYVEKRNEIMKLDETAKQIAELISKADDILESWKNDITEKCGVDVFDYHYMSMKAKINCILTPQDVRRYLLNEFFDNSKAKTAIAKKRDEVLDGIKRNYTNVIANVQNMKDAKTGLEYLKELGFDLSDLLKADEQPVTTALSTPIDTRFLFIKDGE